MIRLLLPLLATTLVAQAQTYPIYKSSNPTAAVQINAATQASKAQQSRRALDLSGATQDLMSLRPDETDGDQGDQADWITLVIPVQRDGYRVTGVATANYSEWAPGNYLGGASIEDWGGVMPIPYWDPNKATIQIGPDPGKRQAQTFWWPGRTPESLPNNLGTPKPYFAKPTFHHGVNTVSSFQVYWPGFFNQAAGAFFGNNIPAFDVLNNAHNEGGMDHPNIAMVSGFPNTHQMAGNTADWTENHGGWWTPHPGSCYMTSMELWDSVRTGYGSTAFTFEVECISGVTDGGEIEIPAPSLNGLWGQSRVVENVALSAPLSVVKYTQTTYVTRRVRSTVLKGMTEEAYTNKLSNQMSQKAMVWPQFRAEGPVAHNVGSAVFIQATMRLAQ